jgi:recombination protein RecA
MDKITQLLDNLNLPLSKIEKEVGTSDGFLSKVKKGTRSLSDELWEKLLVFYKSQIGVDFEFSETIAPMKEKTKLVVDEVGIKEKPNDAAKAKIAELIKTVNKQFGDGTMVMLGDIPQKKLEVISTGSLLIDDALGVGGLPRGRIVEIIGYESSGKTTIATQVMANAQKNGLMCGFIDAEQSFDAEYAKNLGVNIDDISLIQPDYGEQALEVADKMILSGHFGVVIIDSVAALVPKSELEGEMGDSKMGLHARLMSQACRKLSASINKTNTLVIFINQYRNKIGGYGNPAIASGGLALQFFASIRIELVRSAIIKDGEVSVGNMIKCKVIKNKVAPPFKTCEFEIMYGEGVNRIGELVDLAVSKGVIKKAGSWYSYNESKLGQGKETVCHLLKDNENLLKEIETLIGL